jgi:hypothetical protein
MASRQSRTKTTNHFEIVALPEGGFVVANADNSIALMAGNLSDVVEFIQDVAIDGVGFIIE